ncbi:MAG: hypothetical protein IJH12_01840 [Clostridia bacterium]|nr:hypothetical protein [Clostridia bacterium]
MLTFIVAFAVIVAVFLVICKVCKNTSAQNVQQATVVREQIVAISIADAESFEKFVLEGIDSSIKGKCDRQSVQGAMNDAIESRRQYLNGRYTAAQREKATRTEKLVGDLSKMKDMLERVQESIPPKLGFNKVVLNELLEEIEYDCANNTPLRFFKLKFQGDCALLLKKNTTERRRTRKGKVRIKAIPKTSVLNEKKTEEDEFMTEYFTGLMVLDLMIFSNSYIMSHVELCEEANNLVALIARDAISITQTIADELYWSNEKAHLEFFLEEHKIELEAFFG